MTDKKQVNIYPYIITGTKDLRLAQQAVAAAFNGRSFDATENRVVVAGQTLFVAVDPLFRGAPMTLTIKNSAGMEIEVPRYQFR